MNRVTYHFAGIWAIERYSLPPNGTCQPSTQVMHKTAMDIRPPRWSERFPRPRSATDSGWLVGHEVPHLVKEAEYRANTEQASSAILLPDQV